MSRCILFGKQKLLFEVVSKMSHLTCNMTRVRKDTRAIWHACDKTNLTEHPIYGELTQRIYFMITGMGQNFNDKIKSALGAKLCIETVNEMIFQIMSKVICLLNMQKKKINFTRTVPFNMESNAKVEF